MCRVVKSIKNLKTISIQVSALFTVIRFFFSNFPTAACSRAANKIPREKMFDKDKKK